ncbi:MULTISPECIES: hypothetical protein [unclassified Nocardia]|uniref:hypothetical protein n=1 Tax=unclassified Nocardia TaxID=2637762 RepID=UPI001CE48A03|nr:MULTISPECIES: hypothetical protein [unclassified Nocardia]
MRRTVIVAATLLAVTGGFTAVAGPAGAVDDKATCAAVDASATDLSKRVDALDSKDYGSIAELKRIYADTAGQFRAAADNADQGAVKDALDAAVAQMNRAATAADADLGGVLKDPTFVAAMDAVDKACGL